MKSSLTVIFLLLTGLMLLTVGGAILFVPHLFYAYDGILLGNDPSLLSEIRASGGLLTGSGLVLLMGTVWPGWRSQALTLSIFVYGTFGLSRLLSLVVDGTPSSGLLMAMTIELLVAGIGLAILRHQSQTGPLTQEQAELMPNE